MRTAASSMESAEVSGPTDERAVPGWSAEEAIFRAIIVFAHFWVLEGALRKWIIPSSSQVLYFGRDALFVVWVVAAVICLPLPRGRRRAFVPVAALIAGLTALLAWSIFSTHVKTTVALIGLHAYAAPFLVAAAVVAISPSARGALMARLLGAVRVWLPVEAALTIIQTLSPPHGFWNQTGTDTYVDLVTSDGVERASGTFTAPAGFAAYVTIAFLALLLPTLEARRSDRDRGAPGVRMVQWGSLFVVIALAGARTNLFSAAIILVAAIVVIVLSGGRGLSRVIGLLIGAVVSAAILSSIFPKVTSAFLGRIVKANSEEDTYSRIIDSFVSYLSDYKTVGPFGDGIGSHSVAGIAAGSGQLWVENELNRWVAELGIVGVGMAFARQLVGIILVLVALYHVAAHQARARGLIVMVALPLFMAQDATSQPSLQGYAAILIALIVLAPTHPTPADPPPTAPVLRARAPSASGLRVYAQS